MKKAIFLLFTLFYALSGFSQDITGEWYGTLSVMGQELPLVFHIDKTESGFRSTTDSPKQGAYGMVMDSTFYRNDSLRIHDPIRGMTYVAELNDQNEFIGTFSQGMISLPLKLTRVKTGLKNPIRPQEPQKPYPYISEKVAFKNTEAGITLAGTLTLPNGKGKFPAVILISGSGPQNRNGEIFGHKPFLVLSDYLTRNGIAVLRYDDRGVGKSEGKELAVTSTSADLVSDVQAAVSYLLKRKEIDKNKIGLIGHSEGGMIAPMMAAKSKDIAFLVLLAGPGIPGDELLLLQNTLIAKAHGVPETKLEKVAKIKTDIFQMVINITNTDSLKTALTHYYKKNVSGMSEKQIQMAVNEMSSPWVQYFLQYDPSIALQKTKAPVLALNGGNDLQVPAKQNLEGIEKALKQGGNTQVTTKLLPGLNHLFQESETGLPSEYGEIEQTFSPEAMKLILNWIQKQVK